MTKDRKTPSGDYEVGYGRPPPGRPFPPKTSGNPKGRPPKKMSLLNADAEQAMHRQLIAELTRRIPVEDGSTVPLNVRIIQQMAEEALLKRDLKSATVLLKSLADATKSVAAHATEHIRVATEYKVKMQERFEQAKRRNLPPPDVVPHPDHVIITEDGFEIIGPTDRETRRCWETLKCGIHMLVGSINSLKTELRANPDDVEAQRYLEGANKQRRKLMRMVPKEWNWREDIWTLDGDERSIARVLEETRTALRAKLPDHVREELEL